MFFVRLCVSGGVFYCLLAFAGEQGFTTYTVKQDIEWYGEWTQGGIVRGKVLNDGITELKLNEKKLPLYKENGVNYFVFGLGHDTQLKHVLSYKKSKEWLNKTYQFAKRTYKVQRINGLPKSKVNVDEKHLNRIYEEYDIAKKARNILSQSKGFKQAFVPPLTGVITGVYGSQRILNGKPRRPHFGIDIARPTGTPVRAPADGVVTLTHNNMFFSGGTLIMDHGLGLSSTFIHLHKILVKQGQQIKQGQIVAEVGATGRVTGAHLDWRMNWFEQRVDPALILAPNVRDDFLNHK